MTTKYDLKYVIKKNYIEEGIETGWVEHTSICCALSMLKFSEI